MKALKIIGVILIAIAIIAIGFVMTLKGVGQLERNITINAPAEKVFMVVNDFSYNKDWSPWFQIDPDTKYEFTEKTRGIGAKYTWDSDHPDVRTGEQEILESKENEMVNTRMAFGGMEGMYTAAFILGSDGASTKVTWTLVSDASEAGAFEKLFVDYISEKAIGGAYEEGLQNLKVYVESLPDPAPKPGLIEDVMENTDESM